LGGLVEGEPVAANPDVGSARYALRGVLRVLLRAVILTGLITVGWLLGSGLSHADEDPGWPGTGVVHVLDTGSSDTTSSAGSGMPSAAEPTVARLLSAASPPRLPVQPTEKVGILRPVVHAVGKAAPLTKSLTKPLTKSLTKPLAKVLSPLPRPLSSPAAHATAVQPAASADKVAPVSPAALAIAPTVATAAAPAPASALIPVWHAAPAQVHCQPGVKAAQPAPAQPPLPDSGPADPAPTNPPGNAPSCMIGSTSSGASTKTAPDFAVHDSATAGNDAQPEGALQLGGSDLLRSLAVKPSTSPD
jgi:hypothetical protein